MLLFSTSGWYRFKLKIIGLRMSYYHYRSQISCNVIALSMIMFGLLFVSTTVITFVWNFISVQVLQPKETSLYHKMYVLSSFLFPITKSLTPCRCKCFRIKESFVFTYYERCWHRATDNEQLITVNPWIKIYFALSAIQCCLLYIQPAMCPFVQRINIWDRQRINSLLNEYRVTMLRYYQFKLQRYQQALLNMSNGILPKEVHHLLMQFTIESEEKIMAEIQSVNTESIQYQKWYFIWNKLAFLCVGIQVTIIVFVMMFGFNWLLRFVRYYVGDFTLFVILGSMDRLSYWFILRRRRWYLMYACECVNVHREYLSFLNC